MNQTEVGVAGPAAPGATGTETSRGGATAAAVLLALTALGLLDPAARAVLTAVLPALSADLALTMNQTGASPGWFVLGFALTVPFVGYAGDRLRRSRMVAAGLAVWGLATIACGLAGSSFALAAARVLQGAGASSCGVIAPTLLMDLTPRGRRARVFAVYAMSVPVGLAIGLALGARVGAAEGWRVALMAAGAPGLLAAGLALFLPDPVRGGAEGVDAARVEAHRKAGPSREDYVDLMVNSSFTYSVMGMAAFAFAAGGLAEWGPAFLVSTKRFEPAFAARWLGVTTFCAAAFGMTAGGWLADGLARRRPRALFVVPGVAMLASVPFLLGAVYSKEPARVLGLLFCAESLMFVNVGPCNAVLADVVMPHMRGVGYASSLFAGQVFGGLWAGSLVGWVSDTFGRRDSMASVFGRWLSAIGAVPTVTPGEFPMNLTAGMLVAVPALVLSGVVLLAGARHLPRETDLMLAKLRARPVRSLATAAPPPGGLPG